MDRRGVSDYPCDSFRGTGAALRYDISLIAIVIIIVGDLNISMIDMVIVVEEEEDNITVMREREISTVVIMIN